VIRISIPFLIIFLVFSGCTGSVAEPKISTQIVGEWESEDVISGGTIGEIDGNMYLFLMTIPGPMPFQPVLHVLDLHDPLAPVEVASLEAPVSVLFPLSKLILSGTILYVPVVGSEVGGLWSVDVSDPTSPREISLLDAEYPAIGLVLSGKVACIQGFPYWGFILVDISDSVQPRQVGEFRLSREQDFISHSGGIDVSGSMLYMVDRDGLDIVDISSPYSPREVGFYANPLWTGEEPLGGESLQGITIIEEILEIKDLLPAGFQDVAVSGEYAYIPDSKVGLRVLDVSNPASPQEAAQLDIPEAVHHVTVSNNLLYLLGMELVDRSILHTIHIVDISEPESPVIVDSIEDIAGMPPYQFLVAAGRYIYFGNLNSVLAIDIYTSS